MNGTVCLNCGSVDETIGGVCCKCCWNNEAGRPATPEEIEAVTVRIDCAIADLEVGMEKDVTREEEFLE